MNCFHQGLQLGPCWRGGLREKHCCYRNTGFASWWVSSQKTQPRQRAGEGGIYYLQQVRRTPGIFPKVVSLRTAELGKF